MNKCHDIINTNHLIILKWFTEQQNSREHHKRREPAPAETLEEEARDQPKNTVINAEYGWQDLERWKMAEQWKMAEHFSKMAECNRKNDWVYCNNEKMVVFSKMAEHYNKNGWALHKKWLTSL
jgi:hypothetical protein